MKMKIRIRTRESLEKDPLVIKKNRRYSHIEKKFTQEIVPSMYQYFGKDVKVYRCGDVYTNVDGYLFEEWMIKKTLFFRIKKFICG